MAGEGVGDLPNAVLFACTMNAIRSPMAAALLHHLAGRRIYVESAGVRPGERDHFAITTLEEIGIDISRYEPKAIVDLYDTSFDLIVSLSPEAHHQALEFTRTMAVDVEYWPTLDPALIKGERREEILHSYRSCRDFLFKKIKARFQLSGAPHV